MHIYSDTALIFLEKVRAFSLSILKHEMMVPFNRKRLLFNNKYYPLDFVVFEHPKVLGEYDPNYFQIKINKNLSYRSNDHHLKNILRHELAHFMTHIIFGKNIQAHGKEFQSVCKRFKFGTEISSATVELENLSETMSTTQEDKVINKIKKLLQLSKSDNKNEAELATSKANELIRSHNLQFVEGPSASEIETALVRTLESRRLNGKLQAIYKILHHFYVVPIFSYGDGSVSLELIGEKHNVICAEYVANFLDKTLEDLYDKSKIEEGISGIRAKNSFMLGVADGFIKKISTSEATTKHNKEIIQLQNQLAKHFKKVYPRTRYQKSKEHLVDKNAQLLGRNIGSTLSVSPGLGQKLSQQLLE